MAKIIKITSKETIASFDWDEWQLVRKALGHAAGSVKELSPSEWDKARVLLDSISPTKPRPIAHNRK